MIYDGKEMTIERGQLVTGLFKLREHTGLSISKIRTSIQVLLNSGFLTKTSTSKMTIITVCNYNEYQPTSTNEITKDITNQSQTNRKPIATIQECKECNNTTSLSEKPEYKPKTDPVSLLIYGFKDKTGVKMDDRDWDTANWSWAKKEANKMIELFKQPDVALQCLSDLCDYYIKQGLSWNFSTITKAMSDWKFQKEHYGKFYTTGWRKRGETDEPNK
ncbi:MAG: hypothetical protein WC390_09105 [Sulfurimonas sp.]|jgi:predicted transcriptional regulator